jgi:hypothetical protein
MNLFGLISVCLNVTDQLEYNETVRQLFVDFKKADDLVKGKYCTIFS